MTICLKSFSKKPIPILPVRQMKERAKLSGVIFGGSTKANTDVKINKAIIRKIAQ